MNVGNIERYHTKTDGWRYRVRWSLINGERRSQSFAKRGDADNFLRKVESDRMRGIVVDPRGSNETLLDYSRRWLAMRGPLLAPRTVELYRSELNCHILPAFGAVKLGAINTEAVRKWHAGIVAGVSSSTAAKCYGLLRAMLTTAEEDSLIPRNPCKVKGAGQHHTPERPLLTAEQVLDVADTIGPRYRALVLVAAYGGLRRGELLALQRRHVNELHKTVTVEGQAQQISGQGRVIRKTKSDAGMRTVTLPAPIMAERIDHLADFGGAGIEGWVFTAEKGGPMRELALAKAWNAAAKQCGLPKAHLHDLRHFAGTLAATLGATTRELQGRLGHSTTRAAMTYQHSAENRQRELADRMEIAFTDARASRAASAAR